MTKIWFEGAHASSYLVVNISLLYTNSNLNANSNLNSKKIDCFAELELELEKHIFGSELKLE